MEVTLKDLPSLAGKILRSLKPGDVLTLAGPLAAGKTTLTQAIMEKMGYQGRVTSPTFVLEKHYPVDFKGIKEVTHLDFYRLTSSELDSFGWKDYVGKPETLTLVEWPERTNEHLPKNVKQISLDIVDEKTRRVTLENGFNS